MASVPKQPRRTSDSLQGASRAQPLAISEDVETFYQSNIRSHHSSVSQLITTRNEPDFVTTLKHRPAVAQPIKVVEVAETYNFKPLVEPEDTEYRMNHEHRGRCVIFSNEMFHQLPNKAGAGKDGEMLAKRFTDIRFKTELCLNYKLSEIQDKLAAVTQGEDNADYMRNSDCLVVGILTHESAKGQFWAADKPYGVNMLWSHMLASDKTRALAGKPMIFILDSLLQADGNKEEMWGVDVLPRDLLIIHSTGKEGNDIAENKGSLFLANLCHEMEANRPEDLFTTTLTSCSKDIVNNQTRLISTFTKQLYLGDKPPALGYNVADVYDLAKALRDYLDARDEQLEEDMLNDGDSILELLCEWERLDQEKRDFARRRLSKFCTQHSVNV